MNSGTWQGIYEELMKRQAAQGFLLPDEGQRLREAAAVLGIELTWKRLDFNSDFQEWIDQEPAPVPALAA